MSIKKLLLTAFILCNLACQAQNYKTDGIRDLVLIYQGGAHRPAWLQDEFIPYVTHTFADGHKDWLFDGFLFLEFTDSGKQYIPNLKMPDAQKNDWAHYLDRVFEPGKALDALDKCIAAQKAELGDPGFKHKVVLTVLPPIPGQKDWGELDGRALDFDVLDDRKAAVEWYLDQLFDRFNKNGYENIELSGIYWVDEEMHTNAELSKHVSDYVHAKGVEYVWIPYFKAYGYDHWRDYGFDIAYHQPNHFFNKDIPDSRLDEACELARQNGMAVEFEFDARALYDTSNSSYQRMLAYIEAFKRNGVFDKSALAYYEVGDGFAVFARKNHPENHKIIDRLATIIISRRQNQALTPDCKKDCR